MGIEFLDLKPGPYQQTRIEGGLPKLVRIWEYLRDKNEGGYGSGRLVSMKNGPKKSPGAKTDCSPFTATAIYMALDPRPADPSQPYALDEPYDPKFDGGRSLSHYFYYLHNGFSLSEYKTEAGKWKKDFKEEYLDKIPDILKAWEFANHSAGSVVVHNLGKPVSHTQMRRGDVVGIDWMSGGGHAVFCWNVHLNAKGEVDCFQFVSSNGSGGEGPGVTVQQYPRDDAYLEFKNGKYHKKKDMFVGVIDDPKAYPEYLVNPYLWYSFRGINEGDIDLDSFGVSRKKVRIVYWTHEWKGKKLGINKVCVSRLFGVEAPEPWLRADGKTAGDAPASQPAPVAKAKSKPIEVQEKAKETKKEPEKAPPPEEAQPHQEEVEVYLQQLYAARWIGVDPGKPDNVNDPQSQAAIADYQKRWMGGKVPHLGHADADTRKRMAHSAAYAVMMPMVNVSLRVLHEKGELSKVPGDQPMQLDDATKECVKEFQKKHHLDVDGIPGQNTQKALAQAMKEVGEAKPAATAEGQATQQAEKPKKGAAKSDKPAITTIYFTSGFGKAGSKTTVAVTASGLDGKRFDIGLYQGDKALVEKAGQLSISGGRGTLEVTIPNGLADGTEITARLSGEGLSAETKAKFTVDSHTSGLRPEQLEGFDTSDGQNGKVDWDAASKRFGYGIIAAVYHKGGERKGFREYWDAIASRPMVRGGYHFWLPHDDGDEQADAIHKVLSDIRPGIDLPPSLDLEFSEDVGKPMLEKLGPEKAMRYFGKFWKAVVDRFGCYPIIYTSERVWREELKNTPLPIPEIVESPLWLARYVVAAGSPELPVPEPWGARNWWIHQYRGSIWVKDATLDLLAGSVQRPIEAKVDQAKKAQKSAEKALKNAADEQAKAQAQAALDQAKADLKSAKAEMYKVAKLGDLDINRFQPLGDPKSETSGERIRWVQRRLKGQKVTVNGEWGKETADALRGYQGAASLEQTGIVDPRTFAKLAWEMPDRVGKIV